MTNEVSAQTRLVALTKKLLASGDEMSFAELDENRKERRRLLAELESAAIPFAQYGHTLKRSDFQPRDFENDAVWRIEWKDGGGLIAYVRDRVADRLILEIASLSGVLNTRSEPTNTVSVKFDGPLDDYALLSARDIGARGGSVRSEAKAEAARENGKKGGRPRKR